MVRVARLGAEGPFLEQRDEPPGDGVLVQLAAASICGSDLGLLAYGQLDFVIGHELSGLVDGRPVAIEPTLTCGACEQCRAGQTQRCTGRNRLMGYFSDGGMADAFRCPAAALVELPGDLAVADACLVEPLAVALHATRRTTLEPGMRVGVVGAGSIGLGLTATLVDRGLIPLVEARHPHQRAAVERLGGRVATIVDADVVFQATSSADGVARSVEVVRPGGVVVVLGVFHGLAPIPGMPLLIKEVVVTGSTTYGQCDGRHETAEAAALLVRRPEIAQALITHRFDLADISQAFATAIDRRSGAIKVALHP